MHNDTNDTSYMYTQGTHFLIIDRKLHVHLVVTDGRT